MVRVEHVEAVSEETVRGVVLAEVAGIGRVGVRDVSPVRGDVRAHVLLARLP